MDVGRGECGKIETLESCKRLSLLVCDSIRTCEGVSFIFKFLQPRMKFPRFLQAFCLRQSRACPECFQPDLQNRTILHHTMSMFRCITPPFNRLVPDWYFDPLGECIKDEAFSGWTLGSNWAHENGWTLGLTEDCETTPAELRPGDGSDTLSLSQTKCAPDGVVWTTAFPYRARQQHERLRDPAGLAGQLVVLRAQPARKLVKVHNTKRQTRNQNIQ